MVASRLPNIGGDEGNWGEILNDYLSQSLASDGSLKADTVGAIQLEEDAVTTSAIADGAVSTQKITGLAAAGGIATLGQDAHVPEGQLPTHLSVSALNATYAPGGSAGNISRNNVSSALNDRLASWARSFNGNFDRFETMNTPPAITFGGSTSSVWTAQVNGAVSHGVGLLDFRGSIFVDSMYLSTYPYKKPSHITTSSGTKSGGNAPIRVRFMTDARHMDFCFIDRIYSQFNLIVDRKYVARDRLVAFGNTGNFRYIKADFGGDTVTHAKVASNYSITSGGTGYAVGEVITLDGGNGAANGTRTTVKVGSIGGGGSVSSMDVLSKGEYDSIPTGQLSQVSTTGSGSGFQLSAQFFHPQHTTRKMRLIELVYSDPADFFGVVLPQNSQLYPAPKHDNMPKLAVIGDSITIGTYLQYGGSHFGASLAQKLGMWERCIISGIGGTGWNAGSTPWSHANRIQDFIDYDADLYLFVGSQNDSATNATRDAVTATLNQLTAARPNARIVGIGNILGASTSLAATIKAGFEAANNQSRIRFIDNQSPTPWIPSAEVTSWVVSSDANHLSQHGMDRFADLAAPQVANAVIDMVLNS